MEWAYCQSINSFIKSISRRLLGEDIVSFLWWVDLNTEKWEIFTLKFEMKEKKLRGFLRHEAVKQGGINQREKRGERKRIFNQKPL